ncbi:hypothetical protein NMG60_11009455 [Bertholletia excelsa]
MSALLLLLFPLFFFLLQLRYRSTYHLPLPKLNHFGLVMSYVNSIWNTLFGCSKIQNDGSRNFAPGVKRHVGRPGSGEEEAAECAVCLCRIEDGEEVRELRCDHLFHRECLDCWVGFSPRQTCPLCRGSLFSNGWVNELGEVVLRLNFSSVGSRDRTSWWLR